MDYMCPICSSKQTEFQNINARLVLNQLNKLRIQCNICNTHMNREDLKKHECTVNCKANYLGCNVQLLYSELQNHHNICLLYAAHKIIIDKEQVINKLESDIISLKSDIEKQKEGFKKALNIWNSFPNKYKKDKGNAKSKIDNNSNDSNSDLCEAIIMSHNSERHNAKCNRPAKYKCMSIDGSFQYLCSTHSRS